MRKKRQTRNKKGKGLLKLISRKNVSKNILPLSTLEQLNIVVKPLDEVKNIFEVHSNKIDILYNNCLNQCKGHNCLGNKEMCEQLQDFINTKNLYDWTNFCANSLEKNVCKEFLESYKILDIYKKNLITIGEKAQKVRDLLDAYNKDK